MVTATQTISLSSLDLRSSTDASQVDSINDFVDFDSIRPVNSIHASKSPHDLASARRLDDNDDVPPAWEESTQLPTEPDAIIAASHLADASVPDGGYGWVLIAACSFLTFWFVGTSYSWGVIQGALVARNLASASTLAFVGSVAVACNAAFAIVNGKLLRLWGARAVAMLGVSLMGTGQILAGFCTHSVGGFFVTAGFMMGYGISSCYMAASVTPAQYFNKRRGLANGIVFAGGGIGGAVISLAMDAIVSRFGVAWSFRLIGLLMLATGLPVAWLLKERAPIKTGAVVEWALFRQPMFALLFAACTIATFPLLVPPFFLPMYASSLGLSAHTGALLVAGFNFASALGRIVTGLLGDKLGALNSLILSLLLSAISMLALWPISTSLAPLVVFTVVNGAGNGGFFAIMPTVVSNLFGSQRVSTAMGMMVTSWAGGYLMGAPIAGYLLQAYGGESGGFKAYRPAIFFAGALALAAAILVIVARMGVSKSPLKKL